MTAYEIEFAKRQAHNARARLDSTLTALQVRLEPRTLATEAWDGVREKGNEVAETALDAVKERPGVAAAAVGAVALFLTRKPLWRAAKYIFTRPEPDDRITVRIDTEAANYSPAAPLVEVPPSQGAMK
jgi:ElaB/YqjD/DUF883 family membrane-anchored ribosome-binding protein